MNLHLFLASVITISLPQTESLSSKFKNNTGLTLYISHQRTTRGHTEEHANELSFSSTFSDSMVHCTEYRGMKLSQKIIQLGFNFTVALCATALVCGHIPEVVGARTVLQGLSDHSAGIPAIPLRKQQDGTETEASDPNRNDAPL